MTTNTFLRRLGMAAAVFGFVLSGAAAAQADNENPFGPKVPYVPPSNDPGTNPNPGNDRPFSTPSTPQRPKYRNVQHYLLGVWQGSLRNGTQVRLSFSRDGKFAMINRQGGYAIVGYYRIQGLKVQLIAVGVCKQSGCTRYEQRKVVTMPIKPLSANAMQTPGGRFQRAA